MSLYESVRPRQGLTNYFMPDVFFTVFKSVKMMMRSHGKVAVWRVVSGGGGGKGGKGGRMVGGWERKIPH